MAKKRAKKKKAGNAADQRRQRICRALPAPTPPTVSLTNAHRARSIARSTNLWVRGTRIKYYFYKSDESELETIDGMTSLVPVGTDSQEEIDVIRAAFHRWKSIGISLSFEEVANRQEADVRIRFRRDGDFSSLVGPDVILSTPKSEHTMNFGAELTDNQEDLDIALHEIGHTLGLNHAHQHPLCPIQWNENNVRRAFSTPPLNFSQDEIRSNILERIPHGAAQAFQWNPNSIMHYPFEADLIDAPPPFQHDGIEPQPGLAQSDIEWAKIVYREESVEDTTILEPLASSRLGIREGEQRNFIIRPTETRNYDVRTFGASDSLLVLNEDDYGDERFVCADRDIGHETNSSMRIKLHRGRKYILRVRLVYAARPDDTAIMIW